jgi:tetratricopeptide (TPR) repeat protein
LGQLGFICTMQCKFLFPLFILLTIGCAPSKETKRDRFFIQGNDALANQEYDQAISFYTRSLEADPDFALAYNNRGVARIEDGHPYEAIQDYNQAILIDPEYYEAYFNRAYANEEIGRLQKALEDVNFLQAIYPDSAYIPFYKGIIYTNERSYEAGIRSFQDAIALDGSNIEAYVNLATLYFFNDQPDSSKYWLRFVLKQMPDEPNAYNTMSQIYLKEGDHQNALITINRALELVPQEPYFLNNRGQVYLAMQQYEKTLEDINRSILQDPTNAWAYRNKGIYHLRNGNYTEAIRLLNEALSRDAFIDEVYSYLGEAYLELGEQEQACSQWKKGEELKENQSTVWLERYCR